MSGIDVRKGTVRPRWGVTDIAVAQAIVRQKRRMGRTHIGSLGSPRTSLIKSFATGRRLVLLSAAAAASALFVVDRHARIEREHVQVEGAWTSVSADLYIAVANMSAQKPAARIKLDGNPMLVVGDSMTYEFPFPADKLGFWGATTPQIRAAFAKHIQARAYEHIVLWPGTAHLHAGFDIDTYVTDMEAMVALAREHSAKVTVISPLLGRKHFDVADEAYSLIHERMPELATIDTITWRTELEARRKWGNYTSDGLHLNEAGLNRLASHLVRSGLETPESASNEAPHEAAMGWLAQLW